MNTVRCKFVCVHSEKQEGANYQNVSLNAVTEGPFDENGNNEDNTFAKYTPSGLLHLSVTNESAIGFFVVGQKYYLDIVPCDEAVAQ
jgi:hypothetical protein